MFQCVNFFLKVLLLVLYILLYIITYIACDHDNCDIHAVLCPSRSICSGKNDKLSADYANQSILTIVNEIRTILDEENNSRLSNQIKLLYYLYHTSFQIKCDYIE